MKSNKKIKPAQHITEKNTLKLLMILFPTVDSFIESIKSFSKYTDKIVYGEVGNDNGKRTSKQRTI